jgi:hypothetical protein
VRAGIELSVEQQLVAAHHATGRMNQHVVANGRAFRIQRLQHPQRAFMAVVRHRAAADASVMQLKAAPPA